MNAAFVLLTAWAAGAHPDHCTTCPTHAPPVKYPGPIEGTEQPTCWQKIKDRCCPNRCRVPATVIHSTPCGNAHCREGRGHAGEPCGQTVVPEQHPWRGAPAGDTARGAGADPGADDVRGTGEWNAEGRR